MMAAMMDIGPSKESIIERIRILSITPRSLENLLASTPEGVQSKKLPGLRTIASIMF